MASDRGISGIVRTRDGVPRRRSRSYAKPDLQRGHAFATFGDAGRSTLHPGPLSGASESSILVRKRIRKTFLVRLFAEDEVNPQGRYEYDGPRHRSPGKPYALELDNPAFFAATRAFLERRLKTLTHDNDGRRVGLLPFRVLSGSAGFEWRCHTPLQQYVAYCVLCNTGSTGAVALAHFPSGGTSYSVASGDAVFFPPQLLCKIENVRGSITWLQFDLCYVLRRLTDA